MDLFTAYIYIYLYMFTRLDHDSKLKKILRRHYSSILTALGENIYILLDVLRCSIAEYFCELCRILASP